MAEANRLISEVKILEEGGGGSGGGGKTSTSKVARVNAGLFISIPVAPGEAKVIDWGPGQIIKGGSVFGSAQPDLDVTLGEDTHFVMLPDEDSQYDIDVLLQINCDPADAGKVVTASYQGNSDTVNYEATVGAVLADKAMLRFQVKDSTWLDIEGQGFSLALNATMLTVSSQIASAVVTIVKR